MWSWSGTELELELELEWDVGKTGGVEAELERYIAGVAHLC